MDFADWTKILKLKPQNVLPVVLFMGCVLFAPVKWLDTFGITTLINNYRQWIAIAFLASCALLISPVILWIIRVINNKISYLKFRKAGIMYLKNLTPDEKDILKLYITQQTRTQSFNITDGVVSGLVQVKIIYRSSNISSFYTEFSFNIQPWAWNYLNKHSELLGIE